MHPVGAAAMAGQYHYLMVGLMIQMSLPLSQSMMLFQVDK
jgi:hypothetical protein